MLVMATAVFVRELGMTCVFSGACRVLKHLMGPQAGAAEMTAVSSLACQILCVFAEPQQWGNGERKSGHGEGRLTRGKVEVQVGRLVRGTENNKSGHSEI